MKAEINIEVLLKLLKQQSSKKLISNSLEIFKPTKKNIKRQLGLYAVAVFVSVFVGLSYNTKTIMVDTVQTVLDIILALFGIIFTGYALFQALINDELLIRLINNVSKDAHGEDRSKLQETNEEFVHCMMLNILIILLSFLLKVVINSIPDDFLMFEKLIYNNICATMLISIYAYIVISVMWEVKSFIFNLFNLFNAYAGTRVLEIINSEDEDDLGGK